MVPDLALLHCVAALYVLMDESGVGVFLTRIKNCFTAMLGDFQVKALWLFFCCDFIHTSLCLWACPRQFDEYYENTRFPVLTVLVFVACK